MLLLLWGVERGAGIIASCLHFLQNTVRNVSGLIVAAAAAAATYI